MAKNIEIEAKGLLVKDEYELIFHQLNLKPYVQINYYIKNDHFNFKQYGLRIRFKNNKYEYKKVIYYYAKCIIRKGTKECKCL